MDRRSGKRKAVPEADTAVVEGTLGHPLPRGGVMALRRLDDAPDAASWLLAAARRHAGGKAQLLRWAGGGLCLDAITTRVAGLAHRMTAAGLRPGDVCVLAGEQIPEVWLALLACWRAGMIAAPLTPAVSWKPNLLRFLRPRRIVQLRMGDMPAPLPGASLPVIDLDAHAGPGSLPPMPGREAFPDSWPALLLHSSGTTGRPKRILHDHGSIVALARCLGPHVLDEQGAGVLAGTPGFGFAYGLGLLLIAPLARGRPVVLAGRRRLAELVDLAMAAGVDTLVSVPTGYRRLLADRHDCLPAAFRCLFTAGEPLDEGTGSRLAAEGARIVDLLGSSEMLSPFAASDGRHPGLRALPGFVLAARTGRSVAGVAAGVAGELLVKGPTAGRMAGRVDHRRAVYRGWLRTHDLVRFLAEERFQVLGRLDDIIVSRGVNIAPREVEAAFADLPELAAIAVTGLPDDIQGQRIVAVVVPAAGSRVRIDGRSLIARLHHLARARLAPWKRPQAWLIVDELPMTATGKLRRGELRLLVQSRRQDLFQSEEIA